MSGFCGINTFGNLTLNGRKLTFENFDRDNNGVISKSEYDTVVKEMKLERVDLSVVDKNNDKSISKEEFALWGQKIQMQDSVNALAATISKDFAGKTQYLSEITNALKDLIEEYASEYKGDVSKMAEKFESVLPAKYQALKTSILENDSSGIKSKVLDEIYTELTTQAKGKNDAISEAAALRIIKELDSEADRFIKTYKGKYLEIELNAHLKDFMNTSDAEKLKGAAEQFMTNVNSFRADVSENDKFKQTKEYAKEFLTEALNAGVTVNLDGTMIRTTNAITSALVKFTDSESLKAAIENVIANLDTQTLKERITAEEELKAIAADNKKFTDIKGLEYAINPTSLNYNRIEGYSNDGSVSKKAKQSTEELKNDVKQQMTDIINKGLKEQMKQQIQTMLQAKGVPFERVEQVFENVFNSSLVETLNFDDMISTKHKTWFKDGKAEINVKQCVDRFITTFNTNIATAIDKMNASDKDFDTVDLDLTHLKASTVNNDDIVKSYQTGIPLVTKGEGADYYVKVAEQIIDGLKAQMMTKAKAMCTANGVKFDESVFNTLFSNAKGTAVDAAVVGCDKKGRNWAGTGASVAGGAIAGVGALAVATTATTAVTYISLGTVVLGGISSEVMAPLLVTAFTTGPVGWVVGGALLAGAIVAGILAFKGDKSQSVLDTRSLIDGFSETFAQNFSQWVDEEKVKAKGK